VSFGQLTDFGIDSEGTENNRLRRSSPAVIEELLTPARVVAIDHHDSEPIPGERIPGCLFHAGESWGKPSQLDHQTQQRGDDFVSRNNQHITQRHQPSVIDARSWQLVDPDPRLACE
jgi:hypothetical protein